ncbi:MAG: HD domain-containing protein [Dehalococcoidia bacterium]|jgi:response regulator RpfG family c-di-GMP phosphodiesterase|nr:HD domain-containing protein [Dehalococcoidia bacterium]
MDDRVTMLATGTTGVAYGNTTPGVDGDVLPIRRAELLAHLSAAFDLAEAREEGHAARVTLLALETARALHLDRETRERVFYAALLHDAHLTGNQDEDRLAAAARAAIHLGLDLGVAGIIRITRERWDNDGHPTQLLDTDIPVEALCIAAAHWASNIAEEQQPLRARARLQSQDGELDEIAGPKVARALREALLDDQTWIHFWDNKLPAHIANDIISSAAPTVGEVAEAAASMGDLVDAALREPGRARRVSALASDLAGQLGMPEGMQRLIGVAGSILDIGQLSVPRAITEKPAILTVEEMEMMRRHPGLGSRIVENIPGMGEIALWIEMHHERPDGRGYPEMLIDDDLPLPARILAVADSYWALRAERPYRDALTSEEAIDVIVAGAGEQYDLAVANALKAVVRAVDVAA